MAIKFGDTIENQNSDYPVIDLSGGHAAGIVFVASFVDANLGTDEISLVKRKAGMLVVAKDSGKIYVWKGADSAADGAGGFNDTDSTNWAQIGSTPVETSNLTVQLPGTQSFGRFLNGSTITVGADGSNALDIIKDAITGYVAPTGSITSSATNFEFSEGSRDNQSHTLTFTVTNNNQNSVGGTAAGSAFAIRSIDIRRRQGSDSYASILGGTLIEAGSTTYGTFNNLNTSGSPTAVTFTYTDNDVDLIAAADSDENFDYQIRVIANDASGAAQTAVNVATSANQVTIEDYVAPSASSNTISRNSTYTAPTGFKAAGGGSNITFAGTGNLSSASNIVVGDNDLAVAITINRNSPLVDLSSYVVKRIVNGTATTIADGDSGVSISGTVAASTVTITIDDDQAAAVRSSVKYRIEMTDQHTTTNIDSPTLTYLHLGYLGFSTKDNLPTAGAQAGGVVAATGANNASLGEAGIEGLSTRKIAAAVGDVHRFTGDGSNTLSLDAGTNEFLFIAFPDSSDLLTKFQAVGASNTLNADVASSEANSNTAFSEAFTNANISVTNVAGLSQNYLIYRSLSPTAFDGSVGYSIF